MTTENTIENQTPTEVEKKPGLFQRLFQKLDAKMKEKADASTDACCCEDSDSDKSSGNKCC